jgi:hypothetical protein
VHEAIPDVYEAREAECYVDNWRVIYVGLSEPRARDKDEAARWEEHVGRRPNPPQTVELNELLRRGEEISVPVPPPLPPLSNVQRLADEILAKRAADRAHTWVNPDGQRVSRRGREVRRQKGES